MWSQSWIVLYGTVGILSGMLTMLFDYGINLDSRKQQLMTCLQDYMENVMLPRMAREGTGDHVAAVAEEERREPTPVRSLARERRGAGRRGLEQTAASREKIKETIKNADAQNSGENWLQDLNPDQKRVLGELLKEFIS